MMITDKIAMFLILRRSNRKIKITVYMHSSVHLLLSSKCRQKIIPKQKRKELFKPFPNSRQPPIRQ